MQKEAFYFPHFCNARHDRKIRRLRKELGLEGYGIYFMLLETLREQHDFMYPMEDIDLLAEEFGTSEQKVRVVVCNYELFEIDDDQKFFSPKMLLYLEPYLKMKEQRKNAGIKSAEKRLINNNSTTVQRPFNDRSTKERKGKESKVNEIKVNEIKEKEIVIEEIIDFSFVVNSFRNDLFNNWFNYKKERGQTYKPIGKAQLIAQWETTSDLDLERAIKHSIANNYQGLFADKNTISQVTEYKKGKFETNIDTLKEVYKTINQEIDETGRISSIWD